MTIAALRYARRAVAAIGYEVESCPYIVEEADFASLTEDIRHPRAPAFQCRGIAHRGINGFELFGHSPLSSSLEH